MLPCPKQFEKAGKKPGLEVWRVEKMDLNPVPTELHGEFYTGDCYVLLKTFSLSPPSYNIHMWQGNDATMDERAAAAIFMVQLDQCLGGQPVQQTEHQGKESVVFQSYFKKLGLRYKEGGVASGLKVMVPDGADVCKLLRFKGHRMVRAKEMPMVWDSFNRSDCFLIDFGTVLYHWSGSRCNGFERLKTTEIAISIRDNERHGRCDFEMIDEGSEPEDVIKVLGEKPDLRESDDSDASVDERNKNVATLYLISDCTGTMKASVVAKENPFEQSMLSGKDCYILDNALNKNLFVWKGKDANPKERSAALSAARQFIELKGYKEDTPITVMPQGGETTLFKEFFPHWLDKEETTGPTAPYIIGRVANVPQIPFDAAKLHESTQMAAQHGVVDDGSGEVKVWRIEGNDKVLVDPSTHGQFYGGDSYLVLYTYGSGKKNIIYIWQGQKSSNAERGASAILAVVLDDSMDGKATQVRVTQGQEPAQLVSLFKNRLVIYMGGTSRSGGNTVPGDKRLFHIRQSSTKATRAIEVTPRASCLNTNDVFVLTTRKKVYLWKGKGATPEEVVEAKYVASLQKPKISPTVVEERSEPSAFWDDLGGKEAYQRSAALTNMVRLPRLFGCSNKTGNLIAEEVPSVDGEFSQGELAPDDVMLLDTGCQLCVWIGKDSNLTEREGSVDIASKYVSTDPSVRTDFSISVMKQGSEPPFFTGWFQGWDPKFWCTDRCEEMKQCFQQQRAQ